MKARSLPLGLLTWVTVVVVASGVTWTVINAAGQEVLSQTEAAPLATSGASAEPGPSSKQPTHAAPKADFVDLTWRGDVGSVVARCAGTRVSLLSATPDDGAHVEVGSRGPGQVEVTFRSAPGGEVQVEAVCVRGAVRFFTESEPTAH